MSVGDISSSDAIEKVKTKSGLVVLHFWASWAPQCEQVKGILNELAKEPTNVNVSFFNVEAEAVPEISQEFKVNAVPSCIFMKNGTIFERLKGVHPADLSRLVQQHSQSAASIPSSAPANTQVPLDTRLKQLINASPLVVFMKGSADAPRCGFSRQLMDIFKEHQADFTTFDILSDEEVRQGLKTYSNWPTYPQVYVNGELIGGLDIIKEMAESGDLATTLPKKQSLEDRLKNLVRQEDVMVFMKGSPDQPRCGFSKQLMAILQAEEVKFGHFDILGDEDVRQGLKTFSNWPTFPQIYVKGELIGGLDIVKELKESGDLSDTLKV